MSAKQADWQYARILLTYRLSSLFNLFFNFSF